MTNVNIILIYSLQFTVSFTNCIYSWEQGRLTSACWPHIRMRTRQYLRKRSAKQQLVAISGKRKCPPRPTAEQKARKQAVAPWRFPKCTRHPNGGVMCATCFKAGMTRAELKVQQSRAHIGRRGPVPVRPRGRRAPPRQHRRLGVSGDNGSASEGVTKED